MVRTTAWAAAIVIGAAVLLSACTGGGNQSASHPGTPPSTASGPSSASVHDTPSRAKHHASEVSCADGHHLSGSPTQSRYTVVLGVVALPVSPTHRALQANRNSRSTSPKLFAKAALLIKGDADVTLRADPVPGNRTAIGWGNFSAPRRHVTASPRCTGAAGSTWFWYPGGYFVDQPVCMPLTVRTKGQMKHVHIGVGTACPHQRPPFSP